MPTTQELCGCARLAAVEPELADDEDQFWVRQDAAENPGHPPAGHSTGSPLYELKHLVALLERQEEERRWKEEAHDRGHRPRPASGRH